MHSIPDIIYFLMYWIGFLVFSIMGFVIGFTYGKGLSNGKKQALLPNDSKKD